MSTMSTNEHKMSTNEHKRAQNDTSQKKEIKKTIFSCDYCELQFTTWLIASSRLHWRHR